MEVIGCESYRFKPSDREQELSGYTVWCLEDVQSERGKGKRAVKMSCSVDRYESVVLKPFGSIDALLGKEVECFYDRWGKVMKISIVK